MTINKEYLESLLYKPQDEFLNIELSSTEEYDIQLEKVKEKFGFNQERWIVRGKKLKGSFKPVCPMCLELDALGWLPIGTLPANRKAHSTLGQGRWNAPDSACQCSKGYRTVAEKQEPLAIAWDGTHYITYSKEEIKEKVRFIIEKYNGICTC